MDHPLKVIDLLALMGDSADNFPGCPGVGEKTAVKLIAQFGSVENLITHTDQLKGALKTKVEGHVDDITMSKFLATIKIDVPIQLNPTNSNSDRFLKNWNSKALLRNSSSNL